MYIAVKEGPILTEKRLIFYYILIMCCCVWCLLVKLLTGRKTKALASKFLLEVVLVGIGPRNIGNIPEN